MHDPEPLSLPCRKCGAAVEVIPMAKRLAAEHGVYCPACLQAINHQQDRERVKVKTVASFSRLCPPCFQDTELALLPCPKKTAAAINWTWAMRGLNLWGFSGTGKSRTMSLILKRELANGRTILALGPGGFREQCEARDYHRGPWLKRLTLVDILFIDDFDKMNLTRGMEKDLFGVLTARMGRRPVMTTGNTAGDALEQMFALGKPMVDRFRRYCHNLHFGKEDFGI